MDIKKLFGAFGKEVLILLLFGCIALYESAADMVISLKPAVSFQDMLDGREVRPGTHVKGDVIYAFDYFASQSTYTKRSDGSRSGSKKSGNYYLIPVADGYIGLKSRQADVDALNQLTEETFHFLETGEEPTTRVFMQGSVSVMEEKVAKYYREYLGEIGYTENEIELMGEPLVIQYVNFGAVQSMFAIGIVLILLALFFLRRRYKRLLKGSGLPKAEDLPDRRGSL